MIKKSHNTEIVLKRLKDFQRRTAEYVFRRFYKDPITTNNFLVADEVGLGKTLVARGIIAMTIDLLRSQNKRVDIVYICSNLSIASQNIHRLNVTGVQEFVKPTRLSLLPMDIAEIRKNQINYISLTPGTSFDPKSRTGKLEERALIHYMLKNKLAVSPAGLRRLLQCNVSDANWLWWSHKWKPKNLDRDISEAFVKNILSDGALYKRIEEFCSISKRRVLWDNPERLNLVSELRYRIAEMSLDMLEPDLIIMDEFQRFKNLLDPTNPESRLAQKLIRYKGAKTLLLSATPYKMLSLDHEKDDDHYPDFLLTLEFLFDSKEIVEEIKKEIQAFRHSLYLLESGNRDALYSARDALQLRLSQVMCRTERVGATRLQNAMLTESQDRPSLQSTDLIDAVLADRVARSIEAPDIIEYWKSSPYLINFLRRYEFRRKLDAQSQNAPKDLIKALSDFKNRLLHKSDIQNYHEVSPANPRMRYLNSHTIERGLWKVLWLPPSMPYSKPDGNFADIPDVTKFLVFSAWNVVPDAISSLCSYEAERKMLSKFPKKIRHDQLYDEIHPLLLYSRNAEGRPSGMPTLMLQYPSPSLASLVDPLKIAMSNRSKDLIPSVDVINAAMEILKPHLNKLIADTPDSGKEDKRWYWAAAALMDSHQFPKFKNWLDDDSQGWPSVSNDESRERGEPFKEHLILLKDAMDRTINPPLGRPPADLIQVVSRLAIAAPGVCALRALHRFSTSINWDFPALLHGAVRIAEGFKTMFNLPESTALLRGERPNAVYWRLVLQHCLEGNIQSLLDEQGHCLVESLGVIDESDSEKVRSIGKSIGSSLSIRTSQLQIDEITVRPRLRKVEIESYNIRCRFALRFGKLKDESGSVARADTVRDAFNSPFRPFVLASTSVGQEGLDFHTWCHAIMHWNLPSNPVDLEQREGRINRYKGHAVRKNIVKAYGLSALREKWDQQGDPWEYMFEKAVIDRESKANDLIPYWLYEVDNGANIERHVPILDYSKEEHQFQRLKKMLAVYRLVFGQPRQEDLLKYLTNETTDISLESSLNNWQISLEPPIE